MNFDQWLRDSDYSATDLSEILGVSRQTVWHWKNGSRIPKMQHLIQLERLSHGAVGLKSFSAHTAKKQAEKH